jgi:hypothetical protein
VGQEPIWLLPYAEMTTQHTNCLAATCPFFGRAETNADQAVWKRWRTGSITGILVRVCTR